MTDYGFWIRQNRMAQFRSWRNDPEDWEKRWSSISLNNLFAKYTKGYLDEFEFFTQYIPKDQPILEAGCGLGQMVLALSARGYQVEGVDYSEETIQRVKEAAPSLNVHVGDVYHLNVPDGYYGGYISFGVFEHHPQGPLEGLLEARRVLSATGIALISVPYLNRERARWLKNLPVAHADILPDGFSFYQYYFSQAEFSQFLKEAGFKVLDVYPYAVYAGLTRDFPLGRWLLKHRFFSYRIREFVERLCRHAPMPSRFRFAHMMMYICQPE